MEYRGKQKKEMEKFTFKAKGKQKIEQRKKEVLNSSLTRSRIPLQFKKSYHVIPLYDFNFLMYFENGFLI